MKINSLAIILAFASLFLGACVPKQKLLDAEKERNHFKAQSDNLRVVEKENEQLKSEARVLKADMQKVRDQQRAQQFELEALKKDSRDLATRYEQTARENSSLLSTYSNEKSSLEARIATTEVELNQRERQLTGLEQTIGMQSYSLESMRGDLGTREQRVAELEKALTEKDNQMYQLRQSLDQSLRGFTSAELTVSEQNGKIYLSLSQKLLFPAGGDKIDAKAEASLMQVAKALSDNEDIEAIVEGHTDNGGSVDYNWDLSVRRAAAVVKFLGLNGVSPDRLTAAGRGMHHPVVPNDSPEHKAQNRRIEIVLSPNLDKLYDLSR